MTQLLMIPLAAILLLWAMAQVRCLRWLRMARIVAREGEPATDALPPITIVVVAGNQAPELKRNLPLLLTQDYPQPFEVIVVDNASTDDTKDLLEQLEGHHPNLRHTFTPTTARDISLRRLALTLGIKAASNDWVVLTSAQCAPSSQRWLRHIAGATLAKDCRIVMGMTRFLPTGKWHDVRWDFWHTWHQMGYIPFATKHSPYTADSGNIAIRKDFFAQTKGFAKHHLLVAGAEELLVNHFGTRDNTQVLTHPDSQMLQPVPREHRLWRQERTFHMETIRHFRHHLRYQSSLFLGMTLQLACTVCFPAALAWAIYTGDYILLPVTLVTAALLLVSHHISFNKALKSIHHPAIHWTLPLLCALVPLWDIGAWTMHRFSKKDTYRKKFV